MSATHLPTRPTPARSTAEDLATWGAVHLDVSELERSLVFWRELIGLQVLGERDGATRLGVSDAELLVLHPGAVRPALRGHTGLYHLAIHLPSEAEFARVLARLFAVRYPHAPTDHVMHWATYLDDPDGIGLELSFETLDRFGRWETGGGRMSVIDSDGRRRDGVAPLDLDEVFSHLPDRDLARALPEATRIGHVHLHVAAIEPALEHYAALGFTPGMRTPLGMADLSAGGSFPHRLAVNVWQGAGAPPPPPGTAGLRHAVLEFRDRDALQAGLARVRTLGASVEVAPDGVVVHDPSGNRTLLRTGA
jgi:catechol 2,3-dioxygenase